MDIKRCKMTQSPSTPTPHSPILQPQLAVPTVDFDPRDGDLVLALDDIHLDSHPLLAVCSKNGHNIQPPNSPHLIYLLRRTESPLIFRASRAVLIAPPMPFGMGALPRVCFFARARDNTIRYDTDRYFVGRDRVLESMREEERLQAYLPWFEAQFP